MNTNKNVLLSSDAFKIEDKWIGGRQQWLFDFGDEPKWIADRACGIAGLANLSLYLSRQSDEFQDLFPYPDVTKETFTQVMKDIMDCVKPTRMGIPSLRMLEKGFLEYANSMEISLTPVRKSFLRNEKTVEEELLAALKNDTPVLLLTWNHKMKELRLHWVTVIGLEEEHGETVMVTSNWGYIKKYKLKEWIESFSFYRGLLYFV